MASSLHEDRHHHCSTDQHPSKYNDLSRSDIAVLAEILSHAPTRPQSFSASSYKSIVRDLTSNLPSHLRAKLPWISPLCSLHSKIIPFPLRSTLHALQQEIDVCTPRVWRPLRDDGKLSEEQLDFLTALEDLSALWLSPEDFQTKYFRQQKANPPHVFANAKCAGCTLANMGGKCKEMIALGAFFLGRTDPGIWKKSKRILWVEAWLRNAVDEAEQEDAVIKMWELGSALRKVRKENEGSDRAYVDAFVAEARVEKGQQRVEHDSEDVRPRFDETLAADELFGDQGSSFAADENEEYKSMLQFPTAFGGATDENVRLPYAASSIYSRQPYDVDSQRASPGWTHLVPRDSESELLSMYRHSTFDGGGGSI